MIVTKRESMTSLIHDTSPILRHSLQQSHNKGLHYGFRDAILSRLVTIIKRLVYHVVYCVSLSRVCTLVLFHYWYGHGLIGKALNGLHNNVLLGQITISNTRSKRVNENITATCTHNQ